MPSLERWSLDTSALLVELRRHDYAKLSALPDLTEVESAVVSCLAPPNPRWSAVRTRLALPDVGGRSEPDLARLLGLPPATVDEVLRGLLVKWAMAERSSGVSAATSASSSATQTRAARGDERRFCFAWFAPRVNSGQERAALLKAARWPTGTVISVSFLDGDPDLRARVERSAKLWTAPGLANLQLEFREDTLMTDIRISFEHGGSWSLMGTDCRTEKDVSKPTMNFGWLTRDSSEEEVRAIVLHEFGHAFGLTHEHPSPVSGIHWDKGKIYADLSGPPNNWDKATIDFNLFQPYSSAETNFTWPDPKSIMTHPFPDAWTLNAFSTSLNTDLSEADKQFIRHLYV